MQVTKDDVDLLRAAKKLDPEALSKVFDQYAPALYKYALRLGGDPAEADDIVGEVFAQLLNQLSAGRGPGKNLRSYLYQIAYHKVVDNARGRKHFSDSPIESTSDQTPASQQEGNELMAALRSAMWRNLTDVQRHIVTLRFIEGFSIKETAEITGKGIDNIKVIQSRAISKLREALGRQFEENP